MEAEKRRRRILAVDDNKQNLVLVEKALTNAHYEVLTAQDGPSALSVIHSAAPDLVLLDVMMPGMSGYEVCQRIRANEATRLLPVVMLTALNDVADRVHGIDAGADDFLSKPFNREELLTRVRSLLRVKTVHDDLEQRNRLLRTLFGRYVSEDVANEIVANPDRHLKRAPVVREEKPRVPHIIKRLAISCSYTDGVATGTVKVLGPLPSGR